MSPAHATGRDCPKCGTANPAGAAYCNLCQAPLPLAAPGGGAQSLVGEGGGAPRPPFRPVPMLLFTDAIRHNVRMSAILFALLLAFFLLLGVVIGGSYGDVGKGIALVAVLYAILAGAAYFSGSNIVLSLHDAAEADPERHRQLLNVVEEMRIAAGVPMPKVYVMPSAGMNAFAAGRKPEEASVAVTQGLLDRLNREELQGVIAHELAHIKGRDTLYNICAAVLVGAIALLADMFLRGTLLGHGNRARPSGGGRGAGRGNAAYLVLGILMALLAPLAAKILQMSISRQREYHADAASAGFTRNPQGLASALSKIALGGAQVPGENRGTQHLFIVNPLKNFGPDASALMSTHPPTELRIQRLNAMAGFGGV
ncbi:MAG: M48 family metalloprotease [Deltaproteobacteria bacterium]|nr:M48 family metalloprotease [Deltaproteobacteria bacterium]